MIVPNYVAGVDWFLNLSYFPLKQTFQLELTRESYLTQWALHDHTCSTQALCALCTLWSDCLTLYHTIPTFNHIEKEAF